MKKAIQLFFVLLTALTLFPSPSDAQVQEGILLGNWQNDDLPEMAFGRYNEVWGIVVNGVEYGVIGSTMGTHFISLEPNNGVLEEIAFVEGGHTGSSIIHRDFHSYQNYLYAVADEGTNSTLQIIDFSGLPGSVEVVYDSNEFIHLAHNIFIDEPNARLYSTSGVILSLENPEQPTFLTSGNIGGHDLFVRDHIVIANKGNQGMRIYDYTDYNNPVQLGSLEDYINDGYNHSGWMSEDGSHYFLCDETGGRFVKSIDITDFSDMEIVDMFKSDNENPNHIAHNAMVLGNLLYVSYYSDGLQVFDITDPTQVIRKYYYDTYPGVNDSGFKGAWGVYSFLPSGRILVSDMASGFYMFELPPDQTVVAYQTETTDCVDNDQVVKILLGADFEESGVVLSASGLPSGAAVSFSENPATPGSIVEVTISGLSEAGSFDVEILADDGSHNGVANIAVTTLPAPDPLTLSQPVDGSADVSINPSFEWEFAAGSQNTIEVSTFADFSQIDVLSESVPNNIFTPSFALSENTTYYWRVMRENDCGVVPSEVFSFTTETLISTEDLMERTVSVFPNPVREEMVVRTDGFFQGALQIDLFDVNGRLAGSWQLDHSDSEFALVPPAGLAGMYLLRLSSAEHTLTKRVLFVR